MIFNSITATPLRNDRSSLPGIIARKRSSVSLKENKIQVLVLGAKNVGKTSLIGRFTRENIFTGEGTDIDKTDAQVEIIVELMDTLEDNMREFAIKTSHAYILMYSVDDPNSFRYVDLIKDEIESSKGPGMPIIVVGNKTDLSKQKKKAASHIEDGLKRKIPHIKLSLKKENHISEIYEQLFKHHTLKKLTDIISKLNSFSVYTDLRQLSHKAEQLEKDVAEAFPLTPQNSGKHQMHSSGSCTSINV